MPNAIAEDVPDQDPPSRSRSRAATSGHPDIGTGDRQCAVAPPLCRTTVSDPSVGESRCPAAHCDTVLHARRHMLSATSSHASSPISTSSTTCRRGCQFWTVPGYHMTRPCPFAPESTQQIRTELKTDRCWARPKSMVLSALDYITPVCYATPPARQMSRDIL